MLSEKDVHVHMLGVLGAGMAPLASLLADRGIRVTGSDLRADGSLMPQGVTPLYLSDSGSASFLAYSLAVPDRDPEMVYARSRGIPLVSRAELLGGVMLDYERRIAVSGSHGKSTVTALLDLILSSLGMSPTTVSGSALSDGSVYRRGGRETFIYEACEYKGSFLRTSPTDVIVNNVQLDHTDYFKSEDEIERCFRTLLFGVTGNILIGDDGGIARSIYEDIKDRALLVGTSPECDIRYTNVEFCDTGAAFSLEYKGKAIGRFETRMIGEYNVRNAAMALGMAYVLGADISGARDTLRTFSGIGRRAELLGELSGRAVYYDYAHHPTEIRSFLSAIRERHGAVTCIFRPHTFSRTASLFDDFAESLRLADASVILDIYPAREDPIDGITAEALASAVGETAVTLDFEDTVNYCLHNTHGAIALMGAGDVEKIKKELTELMEK